LQEFVAAIFIIIIIIPTSGMRKKKREDWHMSVIPVFTLEANIIKEYGHVGTLVWMHVNIQALMDPVTIPVRQCSILRSYLWHFCSCLWHCYVFNIVTYKM
jgi:hypothetical protein